MKKLLILLFSIFFLFISGTKVWAAQGVDCADIRAPNLSEYGLVKKISHEKERFGISLMYQRGQSDILSYISFDNDYDVLDQEVLDSTLVGAFQDIVQRYDMTREENYELQDDAQYLNMEGFNKIGMQKFINQGVYLTSIEKNSSEPMKKIEIITVGTDGYCIHKVRWTAWIYPEFQSLPNNKFLEYFEYLLIDFYRGFIAINDTSILTSIVVWNGSNDDYLIGLEAAKRGDFATALREWEPLAEQGDPNAQYNLGYMYESGQGVPQDYKTAIKFYSLAAYQGHANAQNNLGLMYYYAKGVHLDYKTAIQWYTLAAEQGHKKAQNNLGFMYENGFAGKQDHKTAVKWYKLASEQGNEVAQYNLGYMYENGRGVIQDNIYAHMWGDISASNGNEDGVTLRDRVAKEMSSAEIAEAQKLARECVAKNYKDC